MRRRKYVSNRSVSFICVLRRRDKWRNVGEYLDYENYKCRKKLVDELVKECTENIEEVNLAKINSNKNKNEHS